MPRLIHRQPRLCHEKNSNQAVVRVEGKKVYLGRWDTPQAKENYDCVVGEWLHNGRSLTPANGHTTPGMSVNGLLRRYWEHAEKYYVHPDGTPTSELRLISDAINAVKEMHGHRPASEIGPLALKAVREKMIKGGKLCRNSINHQISRIKRIFRWATENELVPPSVYHGLQAVAGLRRGRTDARESEPVKPVPQEFVDAVVSNVSPQVATMIRLQELTGMRPGEVVTMRTCDLNIMGKIWEYRPASHKTAHYGHDRVIYIGPKAKRVLKGWLRTDLHAYLFSPAEAEAIRNDQRRQERKSPMTPSQLKRKPKKERKRAPSDRYTVSAYRKAVSYGIEKANSKISEQQEKIPSWHPHQLRHNAATRLRREFGIEAARVILGHRSAAVTEIYAEVDRSKAAAIMAKVG